MRKRRKSEELDAALRAEPEYRELCELLSKQTPEKRSRSEAYLASLCEGSQEGESTMESKDKTALQRAFELQAEGKSFAKIAETLNQEGYRNAKDNPFDRSGLRKLMLRNKAKVSQESQNVAQQAEPVISSQPSQDIVQDERGPDISQPSQVSEPLNVQEPCEAGEASQIPSAWIEPLRSLIREEIDRAMREYATTAKAAIPEKSAIEALEPLPTRPRKAKSREYAGEKTNLGGARVDQVLFDLFQAKREEFGIDASALMERILWNAFGRPKLSFQED